jgi:hypothetical protein
MIQAQVCFSRGTSPLAGVISAASMMRHAHPYTFQHGPATHAYISLRTPDLSVRIDGQPPVSAMSVDPGGGVRFDIDCPNGVPIEKINQLLKVPYDPIELATQVLAGFETVDGIKSAAICTAIVLRAGGDRPRGMHGVGKHGEGRPRAGVWPGGVMVNRRVTWLADCPCGHPRSAHYYRWDSISGPPTPGCIDCSCRHDSMPADARMQDAMIYLGDGLKEAAEVASERR